MVMVSFSLGDAHPDCLRASTATLRQRTPAAARTLRRLIFLLHKPSTQRYLTFNIRLLLPLHFVLRAFRTTSMPPGLCRRPGSYSLGKAWMTNVREAEARPCLCRPGAVLGSQQRRRQVEVPQLCKFHASS